MIKAKNYNGQKVNWWQHKMNGHRVCITMNLSGGIKCNTRTKGVDIAQLMLDCHHLNKIICQMPLDSIIDCELHCPGVNATNVKTLLNNRDTKLMLSPFAAYRWAGHNNQRMPFDQAMELLQDAGFEPPKWGRLEANIIDCPSDLDWFKNRATELGIEGFVLKEFHCSGWYKVKPVMEVDAFVIGWKESTSLTYFGDLKNLKMGLYLSDGSIKEVCSLGSMNAEFKRNFVYEDWRGKVAEVHFDNWTDHGKCNFPRFYRWRDDKEASECLYEKEI